MFLNGAKFWEVQCIIRKWYVMQNYVLSIFLWTFMYQLLYFADKFHKTDNFAWNCWFFQNCRQNTTASKETFTENSLRLNFALHFTSYLSIALYKILPHSKIKNAKKLSLFGENGSRRLSNFVQTHFLKLWSYF